MKPAFEPIVMARKPLEGTVAGNVTRWGTGALNIDATRVGDNPGYSYPNGPGGNTFTVGAGPDGTRTEPTESTKGRWPANVALDHTQATELDQQSGYQRDGTTVRRNIDDDTEQNKHGIYGSRTRAASEDVSYGGGGGASRFFPTFKYEAKAPAHERPTVDGISHPTVKPLKLFEWLARLVTPPGGTILDPFAGSGTTAEAAVHEGFNCILVEREAEYLPLIKARLTAPIPVALDLGDL